MEEIQNEEIQAEEIQSDEIQTEVLQEEEIQAEAAQTEAVRMEPRKRRKKKKPVYAVLLSRLRRHMKKDVPGYYDVRIWAPVFLLLLVVVLMLPGKASAPKQEMQAPAPTVPVIVETVPVATVPEVLIPDEAIALARLADSVGAGRSDNCKLAIMWVAINRSEAGGVDGYGQNLLDEIARPNQWQGYDEKLEPTERSVELAMNVLKMQANGDLRPLDYDMLYLVLNDNGSVTVRNQFVMVNKQKWHEKTVK